jgi:LacI family transcriptional regulator
MGEHRGTPRLIDVATASGVSIATASRALTGKRSVNATLALHVQQVATGLGYVPNVHARSLAGVSVATLGLVVHEIHDPYFSEIASGVMRLAGEHGRSVQISHAERTPESELAQVRLMRFHRVEALIVVGSGYMDPRLELPLALELSDYENAGGRAAVIGRQDMPWDSICGSWDTRASAS